MHYIPNNNSGPRGCSPFGQQLEFETSRRNGGKVSQNKSQRLLSLPMFSNRSWTWAHVQNQNQNLLVPVFDFPVFMCAFVPFKMVENLWKCQTTDTAMNWPTNLILTEHPEMMGLRDKGTAAATCKNIHMIQYWLIRPSTKELLESTGLLYPMHDTLGGIFYM